MKEREQLIMCPALTPSAALGLSECEKCEHHKGVMERARLQDKIFYSVICGLPRQVQTFDLVTKEG